MLVFVDDDVARVGDEAHRLPKNQDRVEAENAVAHDDSRPYKADNPEAHGKDGGVAAIAIIPLIDEPDGEDDLPGGAEDEQPQWHILVAEEALEEL